MPADYCRTVAKRLFVVALFLSVIGPLSLATPASPPPITKPAHQQPPYAAKPPVEVIEQASIGAKVAKPTPTPTPVITWRDNPNQCDTQTQYIAASEPFACIDKPMATKRPNVAAGPSTAPQNAGIASTHEDWLRAAGIPSNVWSCANTLINRESGWRVDAQNPASSAYGIPQALPGSKMASAGPDWRTNPVTQLRWMHGYVNNRYGGFCQALRHSYAHNWY